MNTKKGTPTSVFWTAQGLGEGTRGWKVSRKEIILGREGRTGGWEGRQNRGPGPGRGKGLAGAMHTISKKNHSQARQSYTSFPDIAGTDPISPIGMAGQLFGVRGKISPFSKISSWLLDCIGFSAGHAT